MRQQERFEDREEALRIMLEGFQAQVWTAMPAIVESFDAAKQTCTLQIAIQSKQYNKDGTSKDVNIPLLVDVPVYRLRGGGFAATVPIIKGDEGLVVMSSRCMDAWWQNGGIQPQFEQRMHDLSDGFFLPGFNSQTKNLATYCTDGAQIRNDAGDVTATIKVDEIDLKVKANTFVTLKDKEIHAKAGGSTIDMTDTLIDINSASVKIKGITWETHKHSGVTAGGANTGNPL